MANTDYKIPAAVSMANQATKENNDVDPYKWTRAFLAAMNWLLYRAGKRQLLASEIREAEGLYGGMFS